MKLRFLLKPFPDDAESYEHREDIPFKEGDEVVYTYFARKMLTFADTYIHTVTHIFLLNEVLDNHFVMYVDNQRKMTSIDCAWFTPYRRYKKL